MKLVKHVNNKIESRCNILDKVIEFKTIYEYNGRKHYRKLRHKFYSDYNDYSDYRLVTPTEQINKYLSDNKASIKKSVIVNKDHVILIVTDLESKENIKMINYNDKIRVNAKHLNGEKFTAIISLNYLDLTASEDITLEYVVSRIDAMVKTCIENNAIVESIDYESGV